ncbi:MAG: hypothetical protein AAFX99_13195 [Myxococcota bacterium]
MTIHAFSNDTQTAWNRGQLNVVIKAPNTDRPFGYCDGTEEDRQSLIAMAEEEGLSDIAIDVRSLKTGRQIWTICGTLEDYTPEDFDA